MKTTTLTLLFALLTCTAFGQYYKKQTSATTSTDTKKQYDRFVNNQDKDRDVEVIVLEVQPIEFDIQEEWMSKGEKTAIRMHIPDGQLKEVQDGWEKLIKIKTKSKVNKEKDEISIYNTNITAIYQEPINIYGRITKTENGVDLTTFVEINLEFITPEDIDKITATKEFLRKFGKEQYRIGVEYQLETERDKLKDLNQKLSKLHKDNEKMHKTIKENEANILNTEADIEVNIADQSRKTSEVEQAKLYVTRVNGDKEREKDAKKALKDREKEKKKLQDDNQKMHKDLTKYRATIEETRREIQINLDQQSIENLEIRNKMMLIRALEKKKLQIK